MKSYPFYVVFGQVYMNIRPDVQKIAKSGNAGGNKHEASISSYLL
jgi:hypothetical protein